MDDLACAPKYQMRFWGRAPDQEASREHIGTPLRSHAGPGASHLHLSTSHASLGRWPDWAASFLHLCTRRASLDCSPDQEPRVFTRVPDAPLRQLVAGVASRLHLRLSRMHAGRKASCLHMRTRDVSKEA